MEAQCVRIPLKPGTTQRFRAWVAESAARREEMLASMGREGVVAEAMFLDCGPGGDALVFYLRAHDLREAQAQFAASELPIDLETRRIIEECWDTAQARPLEVLLE